VKKAIDDGNSINFIAEHHFTSYIRYGKSFKEYKRIKTEARDWKSVCFCIIGPSGVGKSRFATALCGFLGPVYKVPQPKGSGLYWDDYDGQPVVFIDEMDGSYMRPTFFNTLVDRYACVVPVHGGAGHQLIAKYIVICSNYHPRFWWKGRKPDQVKQTMRRIEVLVPMIPDYIHRVWRLENIPGERAVAEFVERSRPLGFSRLLNLN